MIRPTTKTVVVIGNGMVGHRFCEKLVEFDKAREYKIVTFCEEPRAAYDRVGLTSFFAHRDAEKLMLARLDWYREHDIDLNIGDRAHKIDRKRRKVYSDRGREILYDFVVLATGSFPFVPQVPGIKHLGVFVYRTIDDLERIIAYGEKCRRAAVIGGGLLGLEAAKACYDLGLETNVVEFAPRLMPRQIDDVGSKLLVEKIERLGVHVHLNKSTKEVTGNGAVDGLVFNDGGRLDVEMIVVSAGIRPRDDVARECGLTVGERGGVAVDDALTTSDPRVFAIGEVALHRGTIFGLVAPGYEMAEIAAANFCGEHREFTGADMSTKLKLMGVDVASFGNYEAPADQARALTYDDPFGGVYKKLLFSHDGTRLLGGVLVGDAADYGRLLALAKSGQPLLVPPGELIVPLGRSGKQDGASAGTAGLDDACQVCSCNNVSKGQICQAIREQGLTDLGAVKACTRAGTGCGGCVPLVSDLLSAELKAAGKTVNKDLCEHFPFTRQEMFQIVKIRGLRTFAELIAGHGKGHGCEICKPAVASILASLWNEDVLQPAHQTLQDTNDRFLANVQRDGTYSVVPRVPGGEITPEKLIALGRVARTYGLYSKITGGQRVDLFGAKLQQLPDIWEELVNAGFESGHAYGKALRTVKSCVGTTWCRYGVQDSVGFAIRVEERYRGIRAPHKLKGAVSGCVRECAEAQGKDFGLIATENGYNLYVCGNGGAKPRHADLLAADLDENTAIKYIDRFLMYYIQTADRLTRTAVWLDKMEGGIDYLREVIIHDKLGICEELERRIQFLVDTYRCEWAEVVNDPRRRAWFKQFVNTDETEPGIELVAERGQLHPADWPKEFVPLTQIKLSNCRSLGDASLGDASLGDGPPATRWVKVGHVHDFPVEGGAAVKYGKCQLAVFHFSSRDEWYATQNMCPHKRAFVLSRGIIGDQGGVPKVACPLHKKTFSLETGTCLSDADYSIRVFAVKVDADEVYLELPPQDELDRELATELHCIRGCDDAAAVAGAPVSGGAGPLLACATFPP
ncbi:MAG TPA: nitrite reductase large subunit NirB [Pirellulales bacterium]|nr:nitrite reductase large subunit NirB [Pirellulales bacterium]